MHVLHYENEHTAISIFKQLSKQYFDQRIKNISIVSCLDI